MADPPQLKDFRAQMEAEVLHVVQDYRGPAQYLQRLGEADRDEFAQYLWTEFKEKKDILYHHNEHIPPITEEDHSSSVPVTAHCELGSSTWLLAKAGLWCRALLADGGPN